MVVTVQVQLLVPEFTVTHLLPYLLTIPLCGQWSVQWSEPEYWLCRNVGYYSTWLWIRIPIPPCGAILQGSCRSLTSPLLQGGEIMWQLFFESHYSFYWRMRLNKCRPSGLLAQDILIDSNLPVTRWHPWSFIVVLTAPKTSNFDLIWPGSQFCILAQATMSLVAAWNVISYKGQVLPGSGAFGYVLRLLDVVSMSSWRKDVGDLWQSQHPLNSTDEAQRLLISDGTVTPPPSN